MSRRARLSQPFLRIEMLAAHHGDCLWIEYGEGRRISRVLVDCGTRHSVRYLEARIAALSEAERAIELFVLTHIDDDHIGGAIPFLKRGGGGLRMGEVWFNGRQHLTHTRNAVQGDAFSKLIGDRALSWNTTWNGGPVAIEPRGPLPVHVLPGGLTLTVLSPTRAALTTLATLWDSDIAKHDARRAPVDSEAGAARRDVATPPSLEELASTPFEGDTAAPNASSIALLAEFAGKSVLLAADAHAPALERSIRRVLTTRRASRLAVDAFKVSHHGSRSNVSRELIELLDCQHYLVSTNGARFHHPHREAIARIVTLSQGHATLHFNYATDESRPWADPALQERYGYRTEYPSTPRAGLAFTC